MELKILNPEVEAAIVAVLKYLQTEARDFEEAGKPVKHIYRDILLIDAWLDFKPQMKQSGVTTGNEKPRAMFPLGKITASPEALKRISFADIMAAIDRHEAGDWNRVPSGVRAKNERALREGGHLLSGHFDYRGRYFWIVTNPERTCTVVENAEGENPGK